MPGPVLTYAPSDVIITLSGYSLGGIMSVDVKFHSRPFTLIKGIRGLHTRVYNSDQAATLTIEVMQTSITNDVLSSIVAQDRLTNSANLSMSLKDSGGSTYMHSDNCFVAALPPTKFGQKFNHRVWEIEILNFTDLVVGGNSKAGFDIMSAVNGALSYL
jgi:hypothetical protein